MHVGASAVVELTVTASDTAPALGSGDVEVLATPRVLALAEEATVRAVAAELAPGQTSVGTRVELDHLAATPVGRTVRAEARLVEVDGRRLAFDVSAHDGAALIARGRVERVVVDRQRFLDRAQAAQT
jgi:fluoroacetyl-CoA thioesterase